MNLDALQGVRWRFHWASVAFDGPTLLLAVLTIGLAWVSLHVGEIGAGARSEWRLPFGSVIAWLQYYHVRVIGVGVCLTAAALLVSLLRWSVSFIEISPTAITYRLGPFRSNQVPLRAIQDMRTGQDLIGLMLNYGTLIIDAGRNEERLPYVPHFRAAVAALQPRW